MFRLIVTVCPFFISKSSFHVIHIISTADSSFSILFRKFGDCDIVKAFAALDSPAGSPAMSGNTLAKAIELVTKATEEDQKKNYAEALKL